jgi:hypothetical protein
VGGLLTQSQDPVQALNKGRCDLAPRNNKEIIMVYTQNGMVNTKFAQLLEWLEDMGVPTDQREQYAKDIITDVEANYA